MNDLSRQEIVGLVVGVIGVIVLVCTVHMSGRMVGREEATKDFQEATLESGHAEYSSETGEWQLKPLAREDGS